MNLLQIKVTARVLKVIEGRALRRIFGPENVKVTGE
jgi:hypothetical protein